MDTEYRQEAGRMLANELKAYANRKDVIVLALPRGGVPVGFEIARGLKRTARCIYRTQIGCARS